MKKVKSPYDAQGRWVEARSRIKGAIRRVFRLSPQMKEVLNDARVELPPALKKDGQPGKKNQVRYRCASCLGLFPQKWVQVDHIKTVVPLWMSEEDMTIDEIAWNIICGKKNLQVLCSTPLKFSNGVESCHRQKTNKENFIRSYLAKLDIDKELKALQVAKAEKEYELYLKDKLEKKIAKEERKKKRLEKKSK